MKKFNLTSSLLLTALVLVFASSSAFAQQPGKPDGNALNFFDTNPFGGTLGHLQGGSFGSFNPGDQWISIGQAPTPNPIYGMRYQWDQDLATMVLEPNGAGSGKNLEFQWGGIGSDASLDFKFVFDPFSPTGELQVMRLTEGARVGIGTIAPVAKMDVRTASSDGNIYGIYSQNERSDGRGGYLRGNLFGAAHVSINTGTTAAKYGASNFAQGPGSGYGTFSAANVTNGSSYGVYGVATICNGTGYGVYGTTNGCASSPNTLYAGYFDGDIGFTGSFINVSDRRLKKNIETETSALENIMKLRPTTYEFDLEKYDYMNLNDGLNHGFIAQELEEVFPEMVSVNSHPVNSGGNMDKDGVVVENPNSTETMEFKGVNYLMMIPVLTAAIQEQQAQIEALTEALENAQQGSSKSAFETGSMSQMETNVLFQNVPNPFDAETEIRYSTVKSARNVMLNIYDLQGRQISSFENLSTGEGKVNISGATLDAGMYIYSLIVDGEEAGTKRMIITKN